MKKCKFACVLLALLIFTLPILAACGEAEDVDTLTVYNWADYIYADYEDDFIEYYKEVTGRDIELTYVTFDTNETMLTKILKGDSTVDVMCPSEYAIQKLFEAGVLEQLNYFTSDEYTNSGYVESAIVSKIDEAFPEYITDGGSITDYFVPYMYGTLGILYNVDIMEENGVTEEMLQEAGWGVLFNRIGVGSDERVLSEGLSNHIFMKDSIRDSYAATVFYLLGSGKLEGTKYANMPIKELINNTDSELIALVEAALIEQKSELYGYEVDFGKDELISGMAYVDLAWSGDAMYAIEEGEANDVVLDYFVPSIAGNIWFDGWVIPKTAVNKAEAKIFIDFLNSPYVAAQNMLEIGYSSAVSKEAVMADEEAVTVLREGYEFAEEELQDFLEYYFDSEVRYPDFNDDTLGVMKDFGTKNTAIVLMWETVRSTGVSAWALLGGAVAVIAVLVGSLYVFYYLRERKKRYVKV
jgi:spermidine/putrescine transport system substrate-binding protein